MHTPRYFPVFLTLFLLTTGVTFAQSYKTAVGLRLDNGINITAQQHLFNKWTLEGILHTSLRSDDLGLTLLAEKHHKILFRGLNIYGGAGGHYYWENQSTVENDEPIANVFGLSLVGGAEISLGRVNIGVDWKPELHLSGEDVRPFDWNGAAISVRYILAKRERRGVRDWQVWDKFEKKKKKKGRNW
jgi:hypothetical protein